MSIHKKFANKADLAGLKSVVEKLDVDKLIKMPSDVISLTSKTDNLVDNMLQTVHINIKELSDVVDKDVLKKSKYDADKQGLNKNIKSIDKKIPDTSNLVTTAAFNIKIAEIDKKLFITPNILPLLNLVNFLVKIQMQN